jgi:hypothetical protein
MSQFFGGGGGGTPIWQRQILISGTFTAPFEGNYMVVAIGGGGGGGRANSLRSATGGTAGSVAFKKVKLTLGQTLTISVGAGGVGSSGVDTGAGLAGTAGGATTVTGTGISLSSPGGPGGVITTATTGTLTAPVGTNATGGDLNVLGGSSDSITLSASAAATGGGAVAIYGFTPPNTTFSAANSNTGGGSVLGSAGYSATFTSAFFGTTNGAGARWVSTSGELPRVVGIGTQATVYVMTEPVTENSYLGGNLLCPNGLIGTSNYQTNPSLDSTFYSAGGAGAGGVPYFLNFTGSTYFYGSRGGIYAGGSGRITSNADITAGAGGILGGGGGAVATFGATGANTLTSGKGGIGGVVIQYLGA